MTTPFEWRDNRGQEDVEERTSYGPFDESEEVRANNIQWTISEDYFWKPDKAAYDKEGKVNIYKNSMQGAIHRYYDQTMLEDYRSFLKKELPQADDFIRMMAIPLEKGAFERIQVERPALQYYRLQEAKTKVRHYDIFVPRDTAEILDMAHAQRITGTVPKVNKMTRDLLNDLEDLSSMETAEFIQVLNSIFKKTFSY